MWISKLSEETCDHNQKSWGLINPSGRRCMWLVGKLMWWRERTCWKEHLVVTETTSLSEDAPQTTSALIRTWGRYLSLPSTSLLATGGWPQSRAFHRALAFRRACCLWREQCGQVSEHNTALSDGLGAPGRSHPAEQWGALSTPIPALREAPADRGSPLWQPASEVKKCPWKIWQAALV